MDDDLQCELETLEAIFMEDYRILNDNIRHLELRLYPISDADDPSVNKVGIKMEIKIPTDYPNAVPDVQLNSLKGVPKRILDQLQQQIKDEGNTNLGEQMLFMLTQIVKGWLEDHNCEQEDILSKKVAVVKAVDENEYKEGTPVTVETYNAWWVEFQAEMTRNKKSNAFQEDPLTGKQFFLKMGDAAFDDGSDSEGEGEIEGEEIAEGVDIKEEGEEAVDWEVFEEGTLDGLDDLDFSESEGDS